MSQPPSSQSQGCVSVSANAWMCACSCATPCVCPCSHVSQQMLPKAIAVSPVMCCPLTFSNIWRCGGWLVKDSASLWLIMMLCLSLICLTSRSAIWHLHDISIYLWASRSTLQWAELVGMTPVRQRGRCHSGRVTQWRLGWLKVGMLTALGAYSNMFSCILGAGCG